MRVTGVQLNLRLEEQRSSSQGTLTCTIAIKLQIEEKARDTCTSQRQLSILYSVCEDRKICQLQIVERILCKQVNLNYSCGIRYDTIEEFNPSRLTGGGGVKITPISV